MVEKKIQWTSRDKEAISTIQQPDYLKSSLAFNLYIQDIFFLLCS